MKKIFINLITFRLNRALIRHLRADEEHNQTIVNNYQRIIAPEITEITKDKLDEASAPHSRASHLAPGHPDVQYVFQKTGEY